jgi:hypothetical protein
MHAKVALSNWSGLRITVTVFSAFFPMRLAAAQAYVRATRTRN